MRPTKRGRRLGSRVVHPDDFRRAEFFMEMAHKLNARLRWLEKMARQPGGILLHSAPPNTKPNFVIGPVGLGLGFASKRSKSAATRTLAEAIDTARASEHRKASQKRKRKGSR
jgi:hypothetical protein